MAGSLGTLGVITEISFKVLPRPPAEATLSFELDEQNATLQVNRWAGQPLPLSATAWESGQLRVRLSGAESAVTAAKSRMGGESIEAGDYWERLREHRLPFFARDGALWRVSVPQAGGPLPLPFPPLVEWGGGLRWMWGDADPLVVRSAAERAGGHATLFRGGDRSAGVFHPLKLPIMKIHQRLKEAFDPAGIFNPNRMYKF